MRSVSRPLDRTR